MLLRSGLVAVWGAVAALDLATASVIGSVLVFLGIPTALIFNLYLLSRNNKAQRERDEFLRDQAREEAKANLDLIVAKLETARYEALAAAAQVKDTLVTTATALAAKTDEATAKLTEAHADQAAVSEAALYAANDTNRKIADAMTAVAENRVKIEDVAAKADAVAENTAKVAENTAKVQENTDTVAENTDAIKHSGDA